MMRFLNFLSVCFLVSCLHAQVGLLRVEGYYGAGYTAVDIDEWAGSVLFDWNLINYGGHASVFFVQAGPFDLGVQLGYQDLFYYETRQELGFGTPVFREFYPGATQLLVVGQLGGNAGFFGEGVAGLYTGELISGLTIGVGGGYRIRINGQFGIPIKLRADAIFEEQTLLVVTGYGGLSYQF